MRTIISVIGKDTVGIIAKTSAICAKRNANIIDITQSVLEDIFVMVMLTETSELNCAFSAFADDLKRLGEDLGLDVKVMHEDVFNSMHHI